MLSNEKGSMGSTAMMVAASCSCRSVTGKMQQRESSSLVSPENKRGWNTTGVCDTVLDIKLVFLLNFFVVKSV